MGDKREQKIMAIIFAGVIALSGILLMARTSWRDKLVNLTVISSETGVWDLQDVDFSTTVVKLTGNVRHIEGELLTPKQFDERESDAEIGDPNDVNTARTARLTLIMPEDGEYAIKTYGDYARSVYLNGTWRVSSGTPGTTKESFVPGYREILVETNTVNKEIDVVIQGGNFVHISGSSYSNIHVGSVDNLKWYNDVDSGVQVFTIGVLFTLFLVHVILALIFPKNSLNLIFALLCFTWCIRFGLTGEKFFYDLIPSLPWVLTIKTEYVTVALSAMLGLEVVKLQFKGAVDLIIYNCFKIIYVLFGITFIVIDTYTMSSLLVPIILVYILCHIYASVSIIIWLRRKRKEDSLTLIQILPVIPLFILYGTTVQDALFFNDIFLFGIHYTMTEFAIVSFSLCYTITLFFSTMQTVHKAKLAKVESHHRAMELERFARMKAHHMGIVAHEIKTPLSIILAGAGESLDLLDDNNSKDDIRQNLYDIKKMVKNLNKTVFDLLDTAALETGRLSLNCESISLADLICDITDKYSIQLNKSKNTLKLELQEDCPLIFADEKRLGQVLLNLLSNANRYTQNGTITFKLWRECEMQHFTITDTGVGMSADLLGRVTKEYIDGGPHGYRGGIGLYVCQQVVDSHKGRMEITAEEKHGTTVHITLPETRGNAL